MLSNVPLKNEILFVRVFCLFVFSTYDSPHTMQWKIENIKSHPTSTLNIYIKDFSLSILTYYLTSTYPNYSTVCDFSRLFGGF